MKLFAEPVAAVMGVVVIGRNEGSRLRACLESVTDEACPVVYVDSASTDSSVAIAEACGVEVIELGNEKPHTAARARNAGWRWLTDEHPEIEYVQFVDGDTIMSKGWLSIATRHLNLWEETAAVCGVLREQSPQGSIYNRLCDIEWQGPQGEIEEFGGLFMTRLAVLQDVDGFSESVIAAEDTELSARLRKAGWRLERIDFDMATHDANMRRFTQWWRRAVRSGHAHAEMHHLHGGAPLWCRSRRVRTNWFWTVVLPLAIACSGAVVGWWALLLTLIYPLQVLRIARAQSARIGWPHGLLFGFFCVAGKLPETWGQLLFHWNRFRRRNSSIIEYKLPSIGTTDDSANSTTHQAESLSSSHSQRSLDS